MKKKLILSLFLTLFSSFPVFANPNFQFSSKVFSYDLNGLSALISGATISVKKGEPYEQSRDPAFQSGGPQDGPMHGYFAVPLIVMGLAGIVLFLNRND